MNRRRVVVLAVVALALGGFALAQMNASSPGTSESAIGSVCRRRSGDERRTCYIRVLTGHLYKYGVADAVATLDSLAIADPDVATRAHEYAHGIGRLAYSRAPDVAATFVACGDKAASGCRHGFMQGYLDSQKRVTASELRGFCRPFQAEAISRALWSQCLHGLGHGLTMHHGHDAPRALVDCEQLKTEWERQSCYGGVFMESFVNATASHTMDAGEGGGAHQHGGAFRAVDSTDMLYPCSIMAQRYLYACYEMQTTVMLYLNGGDIAAAARECDRAPLAMRVPCYESLGRDVTSHASQDPRKSAQLCAKGSEPYRAACYGSAARSLANLTGQTGGALELCDVVAKDRGAGSADATTCYRYVGNMIAMLFTTIPEREAACARISETVAVAACRRGAEVL
jgi:hypothetical protein